MIPVKFQVHCSKTKPGQILKLVGSTAQLGNWNPQAGLTFFTSAQDFPNWRAGILFDLCGLIDSYPGALFEYKYVLVNINDPSDCVWENIVGNRKLIRFDEQ
jgi:hypothetical protein